MTNNDVVNAVLAALKGKFPELAIYGESMGQGQTAPCFFVRLVAPTYDRMGGRRYKRTYPFDVQYFPNEPKEGEADTRVAEMHAVAEQLYDCLDYVALEDGLIRGSKLRYEIIDGVLHFFINYDIHMVRQAEEVPLMSRLEQRGDIKDE